LTEPFNSLSGQLNGSKNAQAVDNLGSVCRLISTDPICHDRKEQLMNVDKRLHYRLPIRVPVFLKGVDKHGNEYFELTHTINVSASGACFLSKRKLEMKADLLVSIPAPVDLNSGDPDDYEFKFPAKVVRIENGLQNLNKRVSVRFTKLLYDKS
jgi:hypothetical protein